MGGGGGAEMAPPCPAPQARGQLRWKERPMSAHLVDGEDADQGIEHRRDAPGRLPLLGVERSVAQADLGPSLEPAVRRQYVDVLWGVFCLKNTGTPCGVKAPAACNCSATWVLQRRGGRGGGRGAHRRLHRVLGRQHDPAVIPPALEWRFSRAGQREVPLKQLVFQRLSLGGEQPNSQGHRRPGGGGRRGIAACVGEWH